MNFDRYYKNGLFDPRQEIKKERHLDSFFREKLRRVNSYLKQTEPQPTRPPSTLKKQPSARNPTPLGKSKSQVQLYQESLQYLKEFTEESKRKYDKQGYLVKDRVEIKTRAQKLIEALTAKVRA